VAVGSMGVGAPQTLVVYISSDHGVTWSNPSVVWSGQTGILGNPVISVATERAWVIAIGDQVLSTADGGGSWRTAVLPLHDGYLATDLQFTDQSHGYVLELPMNKCGQCAGILLTTADAGKTWQPASPTGGGTLPTVIPPLTSPSSASTAGGQFSSRCAVSQLSLGWGGRVSERTQQHTLALVFTNSSSRGCYLYGYPGVLLVSNAGESLPLQYLRVGDQMVTSAAPRHVDLSPGGHAYVTMNQKACSGTDLMEAVGVRVIPPDEYSQLQITIADNVPMAYCGAGDPGSVLHISPVEPTYAATLQQG
jgi:Protein of unknown function (DUF4232)